VKPKVTAAHTMNSLSELLFPLLRGMVTDPQGLKIVEQPPVNRMALIAVTPAAADYRILCGTGGRTIRALSALTSLLGHALGTPARLELRENFQYNQAPNVPFIQNDDFDKRACIDNIKQFCAVLFDREVPITWNPNAPGVLEVWIDADLDDAKEVSTVFALGESFYPYGYRQGTMIKIKTLKKSLKRK